MSPIANTFGWPGSDRSSPTGIRLPRPSGTPSRPATGLAVTPTAQMIVPRRERAAISQHDATRLDVVDSDTELDADVATPQRLRRLFRQRRLERSEDAVRGLDEGDGYLRGGQAGVVLAEDAIDQFAQRTGQLDTGRAATDDDDSEIDRRITDAARPFELHQQMSAQS